MKAPRPVLAEYQAAQGLVMDRYTAKNQRRRQRRRVKVTTHTSTPEAVAAMHRMAGRQS